WLAIPAARKLVEAPAQSAQVQFVIGAVLTGFGICVTGFGLLKLRKDSVLRRDLAQGRIRSVNASLMGTWWGCTSILALVSGGCIWMIVQDLGDGKRFPVWGLI